MLVGAAVGVVMWAGPAAADPVDPVNCGQHPTHPTCTVTVADRPVGGGTGGGVGTCRDGGGRVVPCYLPRFGWFGPLGCYYRPASPQWVAAFGRPYPPAAWYEGSCLDASLTSVLVTRMVVLGSPPGLALLAAQAVSRLRLPALAVGVNPEPPAAQLVFVPMWLWVAGSSWTAPAPATASVPGASVTAAAEPVSVRWDLGDGTSVVCDQPGTPWRAGMDPRAESPTRCVKASSGAPAHSGHVYQRAGSYTVRATVTWRVTWQGTGGITGVEPDLQTTAVLPLRVVEPHGLNTGRLP